MVKGAPFGKDARLKNAEAIIRNICFVLDQRVEPIILPQRELRRSKIHMIKNVLGWFRKVNRVMDDPFLRSIEHVLVQQQEAILHEIKDKLSLSGERAIVSLKINGAYLYDWMSFQDAFLYLVNEKDMELAAHHQVCAICGERQDTVIGKLSVFRFYTLDKPGFITRGV